MPCGLSDAFKMTVPDAEYCLSFNPGKHETVFAVLRPQPEQENLYKILKYIHIL